MPDAPLLMWEQIEDACFQFELAWQAGQRPKIEEVLESVSVPEQDRLLVELLLLELHYRTLADERPNADEYLARFPDRQELVEQAFQAEKDTDHQPPASDTRIVAHAGTVKFADETIDSIGDRYQIQQSLGKGAFGEVHLAQDTWLRRRVAIKILRAGLCRSVRAVDRFISEARVVSQLVHPNIVRIYDFGSFAGGRPFLVMENIQGGSLKDYVGKLSWLQAAQMVLEIAESIRYAHEEDGFWGKRPVIHRDLKPANILIDVRNGDRPLVTDFGLAVHDEIQPLDSRELAGSWFYMAPEQIDRRAELDHRVDIWALGVILYELLTSQRPFGGADEAEIRDQIQHAEPSPPRDNNPAISPQVEAVCLQALRKDPADRYATAGALVADLRAALGKQTPAPAPRQQSPVIPKGLRAFERSDSDFFLQLLPGPKDAQGLPDSIRFWKLRIECRETAGFSVGLLHGPSGCGKSSLVQAGLLPSLSSRVRSIYLSVTADDTEPRLLRRLLEACPELPEGMSLVESLAALRDGRGLAEGGKVLIVLDQFEQWLTAHSEEPDAELARALRRCNGSRVQCLLIVRNDFGNSVGQFMRQLGTPERDVQNRAAVELFDRPHARRVLAMFGQAWNRLSVNPEEWTRGQKRFIEQSVDTLAVDGRVAPIQISLLAELLRDADSWDSATLKGVGGAVGMGVMFLEKTFGEANTNPLHRLHEPAARGVLEALLPEAGRKLAACLRTREELREASQYETVAQFEELMSLLDIELRLITPTDLEVDQQQEPAADGQQPPIARQRFRLAHDFLVQPLREWLSRKQRETARGRAELLLAERSELWNAKPESQRLPGPIDWARIRRHTRKRDWTEPQRKMMAASGTRVGVLGAIVLSFVALLAAATYQTYSKGWAEGQLAVARIDDILERDADEIPAIAKSLLERNPSSGRRLADLLEKATAAGNQEAVLRYRLALLPNDRTQFSPLVRRWLDSDSPKSGQLLEVLTGYIEDHPERREPFLGLVNQNVTESDLQQRLKRRLTATDEKLQADPDSLSSRRWRAKTLFELGLDEEALAALSWLLDQPGQKFDAFARRAIVNARLKRRDDAMRDRDKCVAALRNSSRAKPYLLYLHAVLDMHLGDGRDGLSALSQAAEQAGSGQDRWMKRELCFYAGCAYSIASQLYPEHADRDKRRARQLHQEAFELGMTGSARLQVPDLEPLNPYPFEYSRPRANSELALLSLQGWGSVLPLLSYGHHPDLQAELIHSIHQVQPDPTALLAAVLTEEDSYRKHLLVLALGQLVQDPLPTMKVALREVYRDDPNGGVHGATRWALDKWGKVPKDIDGELAGDETVPTRSWHVNRLGQSMVRIDGPVDFWMGDPDAASRAGVGELQYVEIPRSFYIAMHEVTIEEFKQFQPDFQPRLSTSDANWPVTDVSWNEAAAYCNWLSGANNVPKDQWCYVQRDTEDPNARLVPAADSLSRTGYRLPTEAEWEYACRAGTRTKRYCGDSGRWLTEYAWHYESSSAGGVIPQPQPVGQLKPNSFGLFDTLGNAMEWCHDNMRFSDDESAEPLRIARGGSYSWSYLQNRATYRKRLRERERRDVGFRVVRTVPNPD